MGLDMHLLRLTKPDKTTEELSKMSMNELMDAGYTVFLKDNLPDDFNLISHMAVEINVDVDYIDMKKIRKVYDIPDESYVVGESYSSSRYEYTFRLPKTASSDQKHISIPVERIKSEFIVTEKTEAYCICCEEVAYWRKHYDLQDALYEASATPIQNCGYYPMTDDMWWAVREHDKKTYDHVAHYRFDNSALIVYHEWY